MTVRRALLVLTAMATLMGLTSPAQATFPGQNGRIAFVRADPDVGGEYIVTMAPDGSRQNSLVEGVSPVYSPDGRRIAFTSSMSMPPDSTGTLLDYAELYVIDVDGSHLRRVTANFGLFDWQPAWSPDGTRLVWMRGLSSASADGHVVPPTDLWIVDLRTGVERDLTNSPETWEQFPQWSPDGQRIAFDGNLSEPTNNDVYTVRPDGRELRRLTQRPSVEEDANYSPNGESIAFDSDQNGNYDLFVMRANGSHARQFTTSSADEGDPAYSPDGNFIAYGRNSDQGSDIFRMRADGSQKTNLTRTPALDEFAPDWQAR